MRAWKVEVACCLLLLCCSAFAQITSNGDIAGTVKDTTGAAVPGASVTIRNADTGLVVRTLKSDQSGSYAATTLPVGHYAIDVESTGFKKVSLKDIELNAHDHLTEDVALPVGQASETVSVEADAVQVELQSPASSGLINGTQIQELTLNTRNYEQLVALQPGVTYGGTSDQIYVGATSPLGSANTVNFSINGSRNSANAWTIDGADNVDRGSNLTLLNYPSLDAIAEFKTVRNQYNAEFGRDAAGIINVVTKSGAKNFHGDAYEFFRNDVLNANTVANKQVNPIVKRPPLRYNNFGYTVGGPIPGVPFLKDKGGDVNTFFFFSEEYRRVINYTNFTAEVPTLQERSGVFVRNVCIAHDAAGKCTQNLAAGTPLSSVVPVNPIAQQYLKDIVNKLQAPNGPPSDPVNGLLRQAKGVFDNRQDLVRVDHSFGPRLSLFYRYIRDTFPTTEPGGLFLGSPVFEVAQTQTTSPGHTHLGHITATITPSLLVDAGYAYSFGGIISKPTGTINTSGSPDVQAPNFFNLTLPRIPGVSFQTLSSFTGNGPYNDFNRNHNVFGNVTKIIGRHTIKAGVSYNHYEKTENALGNGLNIAGTYAFANGAAALGAKPSSQCPSGNTDPACPSSLEQSFADFLTGFVPRYTQTGLSDLTPDMMQNQIEFYGQDEWRFSSNLTLTLGGRYSLFPPPIDANNTLTTFDPALYVAVHAPTLDSTGNICSNAAGCTGPNGTTVFPNPNYDPLNGIAINGKTSRFGNKMSPTRYGSVAPRVGFAWDPFKNGKTSIRGGYGIAYDASLVGTYEQNIFQNPPFFKNAVITNTSFSNPAAGVPSGTTSLTALRGTDPNLKMPYTQQWSLDFQRELAHNFMIDVGYFGMKSTHLLGLADVNELQPNAYQAALGNINITSGNTAQLNRLRPYVGYLGINEVLSGFNSSYHSLQIATEKRLSGSSIVTGNYTWSKCLTDNQTDRSTTVEDIYNTRLDYGRCQLDRRNVFTGSYVYELPFFSQQQGFVGKTLGGWEVSGIFTANSGLPFTVTTAQNYDPAGIGLKESTSGAGPRPNQIGDPNIGAPHSITQWFNTAAFQDVPLGTHLIGTTPRGSVNGPGFWRLDASLFKNLKLYESISMQFRAEATNVLNHTNYASIGTSLGTSTFGTVTLYREPRIMQLGLKLYF
jgi:hypothetical protein